MCMGHSSPPPPPPVAPPPPTNVPAVGGTDTEQRFQQLRSGFTGQGSSTVVGTGDFGKLGQSKGSNVGSQ